MPKKTGKKFKLAESLGSLKINEGDTEMAEIFTIDKKPNLEYKTQNPSSLQEELQEEPQIEKFFDEEREAKQRRKELAKKRRQERKSTDTEPSQIRKIASRLIEQQQKEKRKNKKTKKVVDLWSRKDEKVPAQFEEIKEVLYPKHPSLQKAHQVFQFKSSLPAVRKPAAGQSYRPDEESRLQSVELATKYTTFLDPEQEAFGKKLRRTLLFENHPYYPPIMDAEDDFSITTNDHNRGLFPKRKPIANNNPNQNPSKKPKLKFSNNSRNEKTGRKESEENGKKREAKNGGIHKEKTRKKNRSLNKKPKEPVYGIAELLEDDPETPPVKKKNDLTKKEIGILFGKLRKGKDENTDPLELLEYIKKMEGIAKKKAEYRRKKKMPKSSKIPYMVEMDRISNAHEVLRKKEISKRMSGASLLVNPLFERFKSYRDRGIMAPRFPRRKAINKPRYKVITPRPWYANKPLLSK